MGKGFFTRLFGSSRDPQGNPAESAEPAELSDVDPNEIEEAQETGPTAVVVHSEAADLSSEETLRERRKRDITKALTRKKERELREARMQAVLGEILGTLQKVGERLDNEVERTESLKQCLEQIPEVLNKLPAAAEQERKVIETLQAHVKAQNQFHTEALAKLQAIPEIVKAVKSGQPVAETQLAVVKAMAENTARQTHHLQQIGANMGHVAEGLGSLGTRQREQGEKMDAFGQVLDEQFDTVARVQDESRDRLMSGRKKLESAIRKADGKAGRRVTWTAAFAGAIVLATVAAGIQGAAWHVEAYQVEQASSQPIVRTDQVSRLAELKAQAEIRAEAAAKTNEATRMELKHAKSAIEAIRSELQNTRSALVETEDRYEETAEELARREAENLENSFPLLFDEEPKPEIIEEPAPKNATPKAEKIGSEK